MKKIKSSPCLSKVQRNEKDNVDIASSGVTKRLLEKYKSKKGFAVIGSSQIEKEVNMAA